MLISNPYQTEEEAAKLQFVRNHYDDQYYRPLLKILIKNRTEEKVVLNKGQSIGIITFVRTVSPTLVKMSSGVHNFLFNNNNALTFGDVHQQTNDLFKNEPQSTIYTPKKDQTDMLDGVERFLGKQRRVTAQHIFSNVYFSILCHATV